MTDNFRTIAIVLRDYMTDTYNLLNATDAIVGVLPTLQEKAQPVITSPDGKATWDFAARRWSYKHDVLVSIAVDSAEAMRHLAAANKIGAIKALRTATNCGLKEAKEAIEDDRCHAVANDPWSSHTGNQPPF